MPRTAPTSMRIDPELRDALRRAARDDDRSASSLLDRTVRAWLKKRGYLAAPPPPTTMRDGAAVRTGRRGPKSAGRAPSETRARVRDDDGHTGATERGGGAAKT